MAMNRMLRVVFLVVVVVGSTLCHAFSVPTLSVKQLLQDYSSEIAQLKQVATSTLGESSLSQLPYQNDVFYLRYCLDPDCQGDESERLKRFQEGLEWRQGEGQSICQAASQAVPQAMSSGAWDNSPIWKAAPHSDKLSQFLTPQNVFTTTTSTNDLIYCIRAGQIKDVDLMKAVSVSDMVDFFLFAKEVNLLVANERSVELDRLVTILTANDLTGVKLVGGSKDFRSALGESSKIANQVTPSKATSGPTLLLNLPPLLAALVKLFTPLFPPAVNERLRFAKSPCIKSVDTLLDVAPGGSKRTDFVTEIDSILASSK